MVFSSSSRRQLLRVLDQINLRIGQACAWLALALVLAMVTVVVLRYGFAIGSLKLQDSLVYFHGGLFMLAMGVTLYRDEHVRVDVFYRRWSARTRAWVNLLGTLLLLLPLCAALFWLCLDYVLISWREREGSASGGLPYVYVLKSLLLVMPGLLALQGLAELLRAWEQLGSPSAARSEQP